jgi:sugar lactone lactonase YvrE
MNPLILRTVRVESTAFLVLAAALFTGCSDDSSTAPEPGDDGVADDPAPGQIQTWAGSGFVGFNGDGRKLLHSSFYQPIDLMFASNGTPYVLDWNNHRVRQVQTDDTFQTIMGNEILGDGPYDLSDLTPPGASGTSIQLNHPTDLLELPDGRIVVTCWHNHKLRVWNPSTGMAYVMCGRGAGFAGDGAVVDAATRVNQINSSVLSPDASLYFLDQRNQRIRKIDAGNVVSTVVGSATDGPDPDPFPDAGYEGDGASPLVAKMSQPTGSNPPPGGSVVLDAQGRLYFSDTLNHRIRRVDFGLDLIETVVGDGTASYGGDGGPGMNAAINNPRDVEIGPDGKIYIADELNHRVRRFDPATGIVTTVAGTGAPGFSGDDGPAAAAQLNHPTGLAFDDNGWLYIADQYNHRIRRVNLEGI